MKLGVQLYSLREQIDKQGLRSVLGMVKAAGFDCVEFAGFYGHTPEQVKAMLAETGLEGASAHISAAQMESQLPYIDALNIRNVYIPWEGEDGLYKNFDATIEGYKRAQELLKSRGIVFGYHNHAREFENGHDRVWDVMERVPGMTAELDIFWSTFAGRDTVETIRKYGKKLSAVHIKELDSRTKDKATEFPNAIPGEGKSRCAEAFREAKKLGVELFVLEVEFFPCEPDVYLKKSCDAMKKMAREA